MESRMSLVRPSVDGMGRRIGSSGQWKVKGKEEQKEYNQR
jgi:hypothetical protein